MLREEKLITYNNVNFLDCFVPYNDAFVSSTLIGFSGLLYCVYKFNCHVQLPVRASISIETVQNTHTTTPLGLESTAG
jgi:hypothetical protein